MYMNVKQGSGPDRGQSPVEWGEIPSIPPGSGLPGPGLGLSGPGSGLGGMYGCTYGRTDGWTDGRTEFLPILQDFVPSFAQKKVKLKSIHFN